MIINFNTITYNFNRTKAVLVAGVSQGGYQALRTCKATANVSGLCLKKVVKAPFLLKNLLMKKAVVNDSSSLAEQEVRVEPLEGPNPLIEDISQGLKKTVILYKKLNRKSGDLVERTINQVSCLLEKTTNRKPSIENLFSLDRVDFGKFIDSSLRMTRKVCMGDEEEYELDQIVLRTVKSNFTAILPPQRLRRDENGILFARDPNQLIFKKR